MTVTQEFDSSVQHLTQDQAKILAHYAAGESISEMANALRMPLTEVGAVIDRLAKNNRGLAQNLATAWRRTNTAQPAPRPQVVIRPAAVQDPADSITDLLGRATASGVTRLIRAADRIQDLVDQLEAYVLEHERGRELREEADKLEARLTEIRQQLGSKRSTSAPTAEPAADSKAIRAWATANNVSCPTRGRIPASVVAAFEAA